MSKNLQHIAVWYLLVLMLVKMLAVPVSCIHYALNKDYIAGTLCDNKSKPQLRCFGRCYLNKELARSQETGTSQSPSTVSLLAGIDYCEAPFAIDCTPLQQPVKNEFSLYTVTPAAGFTSNIFHPPGC
ncbi:MAG: hypothetical protein QM731_06745 [Chitinophagaceae bacterium]